MEDVIETERGGYGGETPQIARAQNNEFKTSLFGFDRGDVLTYIDRLVGDIADQKGRLDQALERLTDQNRDLVERVNHYEQQMGALQKDLEDERVYNNNAHEREDLFKRAISMLQEKVALLQNNTVTPAGGTDVSLESQTQRANEIVLRLREELLRKDESVSRLTEELSRRNEILLSQDKLLSARGTQIEEQVSAAERLKGELLHRADEIHRLTEHIASLQERIKFLEDKRAELGNLFNEARVRLQQSEQQRAADREALDKALVAQYELQRREDERRREDIRRSEEEAMRQTYSPPRPAAYGSPAPGLYDDAAWRQPLYYPGYTGGRTEAPDMPVYPGEESRRYSGQYPRYVPGYYPVSGAGTAGGERFRFDGGMPQARPAEPSAPLSYPRFDGGGLPQERSDERSSAGRAGEYSYFGGGALPRQPAERRQPEEREFRDPPASYYQSRGAKAADYSGETPQNPYEYRSERAGQSTRGSQDDVYRYNRRAEPPVESR